MRIKLEFVSDEKITLPISYNHIVQAFIYQNITDYNERQNLHDNGLVYGKRRLKFFTFSRINGKFQFDHDMKEIIFESPINFTLSFYDYSGKNLIMDIASNIMRENNLYIGKNKIYLKVIQPQYYSFTRNEYIIKMISPILVYKTEIENNKKLRKFVSPWDKNFRNLIIQNIKTKMKALNKEFDIESFDFIPLNPENSKDGKIIGFKNFKLKAYYGTYKIKGQPELISLLYDAGIGSGNSEGFGCFDVIG